MKNCTIIYLHGANSTPTSFNFIRHHVLMNNGLGEVNIMTVPIKYDSSEPITKLVASIYLQIKAPSWEKSPCFLIGHSLGGVIATLLSYWNEEHGPDKLDFRGIVSLASPYAGSKAANFLKWMYPSYGVFDNVATNSPWMKLIAEKGAIIPTRAIITQSGSSPLMKEPNDGVVSVSSQRSLKNSEGMPVDYNHFEVLLSEEVGDYICEFIKSHIPSSEFNDLTPTE